MFTNLHTNIHPWGCFRLSCLPLGSRQDTVISPRSKTLLLLANSPTIFCTFPNSTIVPSGKVHIWVISVNSMIGPLPVISWPFMLVDLTLKANRMKEGKETLRPGVQWGEQHILRFPLREVFIANQHLWGPNVFHGYSNSLKATPDSEAELKWSG